MVKMDIERLLLDVFREDENTNGSYSYISQLCVITVKSLMPMRDEVAVRIDYKRFIEELKLWFYYRIGENPSLLNIQGGVDSDTYWNNKDDSIISRVIPIVLANSQYEIIEEEVIKNILFTSGNIESMLEWILIGRLLYLVINKEENIVEDLKEKIIGLSQLEFLDKYEEYYKVKTKDYKGIFKVDFEKTRIQLINILNEISVDRFDNLVDCLNVLKNQTPKNLIGIILNNLLPKENMDYSLPKFYLDLGEYILKLRKGRIDPDQLEIKDYILPDVFTYDEGQIFYHSLLKESKVLKKEVRDNILTSLVQTKTGMYVFKK